MNRDGQMNQILKTEYAQFASKFKSVAFGDGLPASAKWVREGILAKYESKKVVVKKVAPAKKSAVKKAVAQKTSAKKTLKKAVTGKTVKKANRK
jgi:hypothetical protein